jgi:thioredoxin 1
MAAIAEVTDGTFDREVLDAGLPALVDFFGDHCPACRQIAPILDELAKTYEGRIKVAKVHTGENPAACQRYQVRAMPTVLAFSGGRVVGQLVGARPRKAFVELVERML